MNVVKFLLLSTVVALVSSIATSLFLRADPDSTQTYGGSRYALINAPVLVTSQMDGNTTTANGLFKIDTATGKIWVLQMAIFSNQTPKIMSADFIPAETLDSNPNPQGPGPL